jgi:hypothetical protein
MRPTPPEIAVARTHFASLAQVDSPNSNRIEEFGVERMQQRVSPLLLAAAAALVVVHCSIMLGGMMREAAVAFCAFALLIGAPVAILVWFGSVTDLGSSRGRRRQQLARQKTNAALWQQVLSDAERAAPLAGGAALAPRATDSPPEASAGAVRARAQHAHLGRRGERKGNKRRILAHSAAAASILGLMGCADTYEAFYPEPPAWNVVRPGMGTAELTALVGPPQQIKSNGTIEVWQYCRKSFLERDAQFDQFGAQPLIKRRADYYVAVWVENEQVREVKPYPVVSRNAGCDDFFQAVW